MKRPTFTLDWLVVLGFIALLALVLPSSSSAIKKHTSCDDELEETRTQLRLRTAELHVAHGQLNSALKKLKKCGVSTEE